MIKIAVMADLHGFLPEPIECDLAIIAGDVAPNAKWGKQLGFFNSKFKEWCGLWNKVVYIPGNHDRVLDLELRGFVNDHKNVTYLCDKLCLFKGLKIYGMPWTLTYGSGVYMTNDLEIAGYLDKTPEGIDILITHGPPFGIGDIGAGKEHAGSISLREWILNHTPTIVCCGHIHEGYGVHTLGNSIVINGSIMDENMLPTRKPIIVEI